MADSQSNAAPVPESYFIEPLDVLMFRGNNLFGSSGSYSENIMPPWPSVVAGALRTHMLDRARISLSAFMKQAGESKGHYGPEEIVKSLGTVSHPGTFGVTWFSLGRRRKDGGTERLFPLPQDLFVISSGDKKEIVPIKPFPAEKIPGLSTSADLPWLSGLSLHSQSKGDSGFFLTEKAFKKYLSGTLPSSDELIRPSELWHVDLRVGIGMNASSRTVVEGALFSSETLSLKPGVGFVVEVQGAGGLIADRAILRFGGDGRGALMTKILAEDLSPLPVPPQSDRLRVVLTTPGVFAQGGLPFSPDEVAPLWKHGPSVRILSVALGRGQVVSGWDMAKRRPKVAKRAIPTGSVYWCEIVKGSFDAADRVSQGVLLPDSLPSDRMAEGYNRAALAPWLS